MILFVKYHKSRTQLASAACWLRLFSLYPINSRWGV